MQAELNELPVGWEWSTLDAVTEPAVDQSGPPGSAPFVYVDIGSIDNQAKRILAPKTLNISEAPSRARQRLKSGDVLVSMTRPNLNAVALIPGQLDASIGSTGFHVLRPYGLDARWLFYLVQADRFVGEMSHLVQGALYPAVRPKDIRSYRIPVAPQAEQGRIVEAIEEQFTRRDATVAGLQKVSQRLKRYRASVLKAACEGRLVPTEAELARAENREYEPADRLLAQILEARRTAGGAKYKEPTSLVASPLPGLPDGWTWTSLEQLKCFSLYGPRFSSDAYRTHGRAVLRTSDMSDSGKVDIDSAPRIPLSDSEFKKYQVEVGDLLITRTGSLGTLAVYNDKVEAIAGAYLIQYRLVFPGILSWYLFYFLKSPIGQHHLVGGGAGVGRLNLNAPTIESIPIPLPPLSEQERIVTEVERRLSVIEKAEMEVETNQRRAERLRHAILKRAFEGKLVPQDPNDEPASVLLERIRAERQLATSTVARRGRGRVAGRKAKDGVPTRQRGLFECLSESPDGCSPEELLRISGHGPETIDDFYHELKQEVDSGRIAEARSGDSIVTLRLHASCASTG